MSAWKFAEQRAAARIQALVGEWQGSWPPVTSTGRVGHLGPQQADIDIDLLSDGIGGEVKSSSQKAKNPGHRITKDAVRKMVDGVAKLAREFATTLIPTYIVAIARVPTLIATTEDWFYRLYLCYEQQREAFDGDEQEFHAALDTTVQERFQSMSQRYQ